MTTPAKFRCTVCGYIHTGPEAPEFCPICGAGRSEFEPVLEENPAPQAVEPDQWQCLNCNYVHHGPQPPETCPICGVGRDEFGPLPCCAEQSSQDSQDRSFVIIGAGVAGLSAAEAVRSSLPEAEITMISKEDRLPYYRLNLTRFLGGEVDPAALPMQGEAWFAENKIDLLQGVEAASVDPRDRQVTLNNGRALSYDKLILAMGAHPFIPPFPGATKTGVMALRTLEDATAILAKAKECRSCVCIGGGILGLETAGALARQGAQVTLLESHDWLMPRQLNPRAGELLTDYLKEIGVTLRLKARTKEIVGDEQVAGVLLQDGDTLAADLVVITTGVRPNSYLARRAGLGVNSGVLVDSHLRTSDPHILAAGDVAEHNGTLYGNWSASQYQGKISGLNAAGIPTLFGGIPRSNILKVLDLDLLSIGTFMAEDGSYHVIEEELEGRYCRFVFRDGFLKGCVLLGDAGHGQELKKAIESRRSFAELLGGEPSVAEIISFVAV